jgi:hypothetical protein
MYTTLLWLQLFGLVYSFVKSLLQALKVVGGEIEDKKMNMKP